MDNFTKIPNEILESIATYKFTSVQIAIVLYVLRKTSGWNKPSDNISISQMAKDMGRKRQLLSRTVGDLEKMGVLRIERYGNGKVPEMAVAPPKDWDKPATVQLHETAQLHETTQFRSLQPDSCTPATVQLQEPATVQLHTKEMKYTLQKKRKKEPPAPLFLTEEKAREMFPDEEGWS